jgi:hypothetical protein
MKSDERYIIKGILAEYPCRVVVNKLIKKFNKETIVLNNDDLSTLHVILVAALDNLNEDESNFIMGFIDNIS